ncbi:hypothetical protein PBAL39_22285 [Pedobacter sp. BAL39]|nr:hypothetical protein PBAL39_22285 [Pedobacter sp. BAL39]
MENLISSLPDGVTPWFYRTAAGAEIDLVIEVNARKKIAIEIKRSLSPSTSKGFAIGSEDVGATDCFIVYPHRERFALNKYTSAIPLLDMMKELRNIRSS